MKWSQRRANSGDTSPCSNAATNAAPVSYALISTDRANSYISSPISVVLFPGKAMPRLTR